MAQALQNLTIASPGFGGLNTADSPLLVPNTFASEANNVVIDTNIDIYKIRNSSDTLTIKSTTPWYVFGNRFKMTKILLNEFNETKFNYIMNEDL